VRNSRINFRSQSGPPKSVAANGGSFAQAQGGTGRRVCVIPEWGGDDFAVLKNQFNPAFHAASCDTPSRRLASACSINSRADATVARWRDCLQNLKYSTIAR
jgi:hypothetical protein